MRIVSDTLPLGNGIVLFKNRIDVDTSIIEELAEMKKSARDKHYSFVKDESGNILYATNKSGHRFELDDIEKNCSRITDFRESSSESLSSFFVNCEKIIYNTLLEYGSIYPMSIPCFWWKTKGHVLAYGPGSDLGLHCDNDINYQPGFEPDYQLGIRHVLAAITYFNSSVEEYDGINFTGGEINFPYANVTYKPSAGDILMFPANFISTHEVLGVKDGNRYAYLEYFGQGSSDPDRGVNIREDGQDVFSGQVWLSSLYDDYREYVISKYGDAGENLMLLPVSRKFHSKSTKEEVEK
jgi:hypothetical protein